MPAVCEAAKAVSHAAMHNEGDGLMTKILKLLDRTALTLINVFVVAGLPLAAVGLITNTL
jgi:hypothetical protein